MLEVYGKICVSAVLLGLFSSMGQASNLIIDGGFEQPFAGPGGVDTGYTDFTVGQPINSGWTVIGFNTSDVSVIPGTEISGHGGTFNVQEGTQALDLTGDFDNGVAMGVEQAIGTNAGSQYTLTFYVGNFTSLDGGGRGAATVLVDLNGSPFQTVSNTSSTVGAVNWQLFTFNFTASGPNTTLDFINGTAGGVLFNGLDNVQVDAPVPEPSALMLAGIGLMALSLVRWRVGAFKLYR
jgi:Protein of unknown function (DUF642)/PEP-CTERM motif